MAQAKTLSLLRDPSSNPNPNPTFTAAHFPPACLLPSLLPPCMSMMIPVTTISSPNSSGPTMLNQHAGFLLGFFLLPIFFFFFSIFVNLWFLIRILLRLLIRIIPVISFIFLLRTDSSQANCCLLRTDSSDNAHRPGRAHSFRVAAASKFRRSRPEGAMPVPQSHIPIYVGDEIEQFSISAELLNHPVFVTLLKKSAQEYGYEQKGVLRIPCHMLVFERVLEAIRIGDQDSLDLQDLLFFFCLFRFLSISFTSFLYFAFRVLFGPFFFLSSFFCLLCFLLSEQEIRVGGRELRRLRFMSLGFDLSLIGPLSNLSPSSSSSLSSSLSLSTYFMS